MIQFKFLIIAGVYLLAFTRQANAQKFRWLQTKNDTSYITDLTQDLTIRLYGSRKYTSYHLSDLNLKQRLTYRPNSPLNFGFGFNYKFLGLNIGINFPFVNTHDVYGKTKFLDLQSHLYLRKLVIDFYGQYYNGYYLANPSALTGNNHNRVYRRPDLRTLNIGMSAQYIFNDRRFSFRSAYLQNEYQKKSSGSFMAGGDMHAILIRSDSAIVPANIRFDDFFNNNHFNRSNIYSVTINGGYAYTFVIKKHFFTTLAAHGGFGFNYTTLQDPFNGANDNGVQGQLNATIRIAAGYNSERYFAGIHYVNIMMRNYSPLPYAMQEFGAGNFRFSFARRFKVNKPLIKRWNL